MQKILLIIVLAICGCMPVMADPASDAAAQRKELQDFKLKYFIKEMDLSADKQQEFIRLYTQYDQSREALFNDIRSRYKAIKGKTAPTDADYLGIAEAMASFKAKEGDLEKSFFGQLKTILSPKQLYQLKKAEHKFQRKCMELQHKPGGNKQKKK